MNAPPGTRGDRPEDSLPPDELERVIAACDRFEAAWRDGPRPAIEVELATAPGRLRPRLFRELLALELELRRGDGEEPTRDDYLGRFPDDRDAVVRLVARAEAGHPADRPPVDRPGGGSRAIGAERDLLFGLLALQNGFIDRAALLAAFNAWLTDRARPLGEILVGDGALARETHDALQILVAAHVKDHGGDPRRSLSTLSPPSTTRDALDGLDDPDLRFSLAAVGLDRAGAGDDPEVTITHLPVAGSRADDRFRVLRPHARGGLGEVHVALDRELNREVALKQILNERADSDGDRRRFVFEAEVTGGLEHPGIVPVYSLGTDPDNGRPYYAMRFIRGDSLKDAIAAYHSGEAKRARLSERSLQLRRLLAQLIDACNAIAYAHDRGVLHRDLKPSNILVGKYGETLVVDWGLAKVLGRPEEPPSPLDEPTLRPPSGSDLPQTLPGSALGTPQYMPPEQSEGRLDLIGPASDVYSLGATLYTILIGRPAFPQKTVPEVLAAVRRGDFPPPRTLSPEVSRLLEAICLKAMAPRPGDRYQTAAALAEDLERWLADEPVLAYPEPWLSRARRWTKRHRTLVSTIAATLLVSLLAIASGSVVLASKNRELAIQARRAEDREQLAIDAVKNYADVVIANPELRDDPALEGLRTSLLKEPIGFFRTLRARLEADRSTAPEHLEALADASADLSWLTMKIGNLQDALSSSGQALEIRQQLARESSAGPERRRDVAVSHIETGALLMELGRRADAVSSYEQALVVLDEIERDFPGDLPTLTRRATCLNHLGKSQRASGETEQALRSHQLAVELQRRFVDRNPEDPEAFAHLGSFLRDLGLLRRATSQLAEAKAAYEDAIKIFDRLVHLEPDNVDFWGSLATVHNNLGLLREGLEGPEAAMRSYEDAQEIYRRLTSDHPSLQRYRQFEAGVLYNMGRVHLAQGQPEQALGRFDEARRAFERLVEKNPSVFLLQNELANTLGNIGIANRRLDRSEDALASYRAAAEIQERLAKEHPDNIMMQSGLGRTFGNIANLLGDSGRPDEARAYHAQALAIRERLVAENAEISLFRHDLGSTFGNLALIDRDQGRMDDARARLLKAIDEQEIAVRREPGNREYRRFLSSHLRSLAEVELELAHPARAAEALRRWASGAGDDPYDLYDIACLYCRCSAAAKSMGPGGEADASAEPLEDRAMSALNRAVASGWSDAPHTARDPDLIPLRHRDDFQRLLGAMFDRSFPDDPFAR